MLHLSLGDVKYSSIFLTPLTFLLSYIILLSSLYHTSLAIYEIDDTVALLRDILFRDHLDRLLCDYTSHEGGSVRNIGGGGSNAGARLAWLNLRKRNDLQLSDDVL